MKTTILRATCILAGLIGSAFSGDAEVLTAGIPFDFVAGAKRLPAGKYIFSVENGVLLVQGAAPIVVSVMTAVRGDAAVSPASPSAAFEKSATTAVLSRITLPSGSAYLVPALTHVSKHRPLADSGVVLSRHE
jgi:hypothetical protein